MRHRLAIIGLTFQYTTSRISRTEYEKYHSIYHDEVARMNPAPLESARKDGDFKSQHPDDRSVYANDELRFMLFRHWNLYDAMYHSSYVASRLGIWKERGRKRLTGLLAKMGYALNIRKTFMILILHLFRFSIAETQQTYSHMAKDLKLGLRQKLDQIAPEYGLVELTYPSFTRCYGYLSQPLSACDAVESVSALLDIAGGIRMEVEVEGARNGGEWFGAGHVWEAGGREGSRSGEDKENVLVGGIGSAVGKGKERDGEEEKELQWWVRNFWTAYDALDECVLLLFTCVCFAKGPCRQCLPASPSSKPRYVSAPCYHPPGHVDHRQTGNSHLPWTPRRRPQARPRPRSLRTPWCTISARIVACRRAARPHAAARERGWREGETEKLAVCRRMFERESRDIHRGGCHRSVRFW